MATPSAPSPSSFFLSSIEAIAARAPEAFRANYAQVAKLFREHPRIAQKRVKWYAAVGRAPDPPAVNARTGVIDVAYRTYLAADYEEPVVSLTMERAPGRAPWDEAPGVLSITLCPQSLRSVPHIDEDGLTTVVRADAQLYKPGMPQHTVGEFLAFLAADRSEDPLLQYVFTPHTHGAYWHYFVLYRLALEGFLPGGSALAFAQAFDSWNNMRRDAFLKATGGRETGDFLGPLRWPIDADVQTKEGRFERNTTI